MKPILIGIYLITIGVLGYCVHKSHSMKTQLARRVRNILFCAFFCVMMDCIAVNSNSESISHVCYSLALFGVDFLVCTFTWFAVEYAEYHRAGKYLKPISAALLGIDAISLLANITTGHIFYVSQVTMLGGNTFYVFNPLQMYFVHFATSVFFSVLSLFLLIRRCVYEPGIYKIRYINIVLGTILCLGLNVGFALLGLKLDISFFSYGVVGFVIYYYTLIHSPKELIESAYTMMVEEHEDIILILDYKRKFIDMNRSAKKFFDLEAGFENADEVINKWFSAHHFSFSSEEKKTDIKEDSEEGRISYYTAITGPIIGEKGSILGYFMTMKDNTQEEEKRLKDWYNATHDYLTGLYNRNTFMENAREILNNRKDSDYVLVCSDIENFKLVNDIFGENYGDEVLKELASSIQSLLGKDEVMGRLGNDIFAFLMEKKNLRQEDLMEAALKVVPEDVHLSLQVHVHYGVYEVTNADRSISEMCERALIAIKNVKGRLEDAVVYYDDRVRDDTLEEQELIAEIEPAIEKGQFVFFLQPQVDTEGKILGGEALVRWHHPEKGLVPPGKFIAILEKKGLIPKLDRCIWEQACAKLKDWKDIGRDDLYISVNISPRDFYYLDVYETFTGLVKKYDIDPRNLRLEITETAVMQNLSEQIKLIDNVRDAGFVVEMDDFGSGYSSLNTLKDIHMDILKIDMGFLGDGVGDERSRTILEIVVDLAKRLKMPTVIEGVEHKEEVEFLKTIGCNVFQGYYFAKPMEVKDFEEKYMNITHEKVG